VPLKALVRASGDQTNISYVSPYELVPRYALSAELARGLTGIETVTGAVRNRPERVASSPRPLLEVVAL
jgi:hypothetical protein